jgi:hypothetical protein
MVSMARNLTFLLVSFNRHSHFLSRVHSRWFWRGKPQGAGEMENALAIRPIGLHKYKKADQIRELEETFFGPASSKVMSRLNPVVKTYVEKVRRAMGVDEL